MEKLKQALWNDYEENSSVIDELEIGSGEYKTHMEERDKIRNELIKVEQIEADREMKNREIESDNRNEKIRNRITIATFAVSTVVSIYTVVKTFRFDQGATVTSTLGRNVLNNVTSKIFKR
jgi:hypothetical protein